MCWGSVAQLGVGAAGAYGWMTQQLASCCKRGTARCESSEELFSVVKTLNCRHYWFNQLVELKGGSNREVFISICSAIYYGHLLWHGIQVVLLFIFWCKHMSQPGGDLSG